VTIFLQACLSKDSQTLSFTGKDVPLKEIFKIIKSQTGVLFFYNEVLLGDAKPVIVNWKNVTLETALNDTFKAQSLTWVLENKTVTIVKRADLIKN